MCQIMYCKISHSHTINIQHTSQARILVSLNFWLFIYIYLHIAIHCEATEKLSSVSRLTLVTACTRLAFFVKFQLPIALESGFTLVATHSHNLSFKTCIQDFLNWGTAEARVCVSLPCSCLLAYSCQHYCQVIDTHWHSSVLFLDDVLI